MHVDYDDPKIFRLVDFGDTKILQVLRHKRSKSSHLNTLNLTQDVVSSRNAGLYSLVPSLARRSISLCEKAGGEGRHWVWLGVVIRY
jgi:hypothetical protein